MSSRFGSSLACMVVALGSPQCTTSFAVDRAETDKPSLARVTPISADRVAALWNDLDSPDATCAYGAMKGLASVQRQALALIRQYLQSGRPIDPLQISRLITDLDDSTFVVREKASVELDRLGIQAEPALRKTMGNKPSLEVSRRIERLLQSLEEPSRHKGYLRGLRIVPLLEEIGTDEARQLLEKIARGPRDSQPTTDAQAALKRLARQNDPEMRMAAKGPNTDPPMTVIVEDVSKYLQNPKAPVRKGRLEFTVSRLLQKHSDKVRLEADFSHSYNWFSLGYKLQGIMDTPKLSSNKVDATELSEVQITYTDDHLEAAKLNEGDVEALVQQLYQQENKMEIHGISIPGGELLHFSAPMKKLIMLGERARARLQQYVADPRIQNEVSLVLGAIGNEKTVPLLIDAYPLPIVGVNGESETDNRHSNAVFLTFALTYLTNQPIGRSRGGADCKPENRNLWKAWWSEARLRFKVPKEKTNASWVPSYPWLSQEGAENARKQFVSNRQD
jgi:hypothetical protein